MATCLVFSIVSICNKVVCRFNLYSLMVGLSIAALLASCSSLDQGRSIVVYTSGCTDTEIVDDILQSKKGIEDFADSRNITIKFDVAQNKCGYGLFGNSKVKFIDGAVTDYDLRGEVSIFFHVDS